MKQRDYDSTVARIAGNILSGMAAQGQMAHEPGHGMYPRPLDTSDADRALYLARYIARKAQEPETPEER